MTTATCLDHLEALSALVDGEVSPLEAEHLKQHLAGCSSCKQAYEAMSGLHLKMDLPVETSFARQTAAFVRSRSTPPPRGPWGGIKQLWAHPIRELAAPIRRRRIGLGFFDVARMVCLFGVPAILMSLLRDSAPLLTFSGVAGVGLLVGLPMRHFSAEVALLGQLRRGRCLEEILGTGMSASSLVDALATQGLTQMLVACLPLLPAFLLGALAAPAEWKSAAWTAWGLWLPAAAGLFLTGSYVAQFFQAWTGATMAMFGLTALFFGPPLFLLTHLQVTSYPELGLELLLELVAIGYLSRLAAIWGLKNSSRVARWAKRGLLQRDNQRNSFLPTYSQNPIVRRELARMAGSVPGGVKGLFLWRLSLVIFPLLWAWSALYSSWDMAFWSGIAGFSALLFIRAASRTLYAVVNEREQGSWETLIQSRLGVKTFSLGWIQVALYTVCLEGVFGTFVLLLYGLMAPRLLVATGSFGDGCLVALWAALALLSSSFVGAVVGLAISAISATSREAATSLVSLSFKATGIWLALWGGLVAAMLTAVADNGERSWLDLLWHDAPLAAAGILGLGLLVWARFQLNRSLFVLEGNSSARSEQKPSTYPATLLPLDMSSLGFISYAAAVVLLINTSGPNDIQPLRMSFNLVEIILAWGLLIRLPLASLCELCLGRKASFATGLLNGLIAGVSLPLLTATVTSMTRSGVVNKRHWLQMPAITPDIILISLVGCALLGLLLGVFALRASAPSPRRVRQLRSRLGWSGSLAGVAAGLAALWLTRTFSIEYDHPTETGELRQRTEARLYRSVPPDQNGFNLVRAELMRTPHPTGWGALAEYTNSRMNRKATLAELRTEKARTARTKFLEFIPQLDATLAKPEFHRILHPDNSDMWPLLSGIRTISQNLEILGLSQEADGDWNRAFETDLRGLRWGELLTGRARLLDEIIGISIETTQVNRMLALETNHPVTPREGRRLISWVESSRFHPENLALDVEAEMAVAWRFLEHPSLETVSAAEMWMPPMPGFYLRYQSVAIANACETWLPSIRALKVERFRLQDPIQQTLKEYPMARMASYITPNLARATTNYAGLLTRLEGLRTVAALNLYHHDHQAWPATLQALVGPYLKTAPVCWSMPSHQFGYRVEQGRPVLEAYSVVTQRKGESHTILFPYDFEANR